MHACNLLLYLDGWQDQLRQVEQLAESLTNTAPEKLHASAAYRMLVSACGLRPDAICLLHNVYIVLACIFTIAGEAAVIFDPRPPPELTAARCLSSLPQSLQLRVLRSPP